MNFDEWQRPCKNSNIIRITDENTKNYISNILQNKEKYNIYFTGSRCFGIDKIYSDYDYFMVEETYEELFSNYKLINYEDTEFSCIKLQIDDKKIDFIVLKDALYLSWVYATSLFKTLIKYQDGFKELIRNKKNRVIFFEAVKKLKKENNIKIKREKILLQKLKDKYEKEK